eukprot:1418452-Rhodomonas_salina.1
MPLHLCLGAVVKRQFRYWRPGLHDRALPIHVPVLELPTVTNARAFLTGERPLTPGGVTLVRLTDRLPTLPLVHGDTTSLSEEPLSSDDEERAVVPPPPKKRKTVSDDGKDTVLRAYHIRMRPDKHARAALRHMLAGVNATHNMTVAHLRDCSGFQSAYN